MQNIMQLLSVFAGVSITIGIIIIILANAVSDCTILPGYNTSLADSAQTDGWVSRCQANNTQTQAAMGLLIVVEVVIAAVIIINVVKMI